MKIRTITRFATTTGLSLLCAAMLIGCSKNEPTVDPLAIRLNAGLHVTTKAPINDGSNFTATVAGWESAANINYGIKRTWQSTSTIIASATAEAITLADLQYYSQDGAIKTYIKAWCPSGTLSDNGIVSFDGAHDGTLDVLLTEDEISGSALDAASKTMVFNHPLTQFKFTVQCDALFGTTTTIKSITIKDAEVPTGIDLKTNTVTHITTNLNTPGIDGTQTITTTKELIGQPIMIKPIEGSSFKIDVETSHVTYHDVVVTVSDPSIIAGKAYTIALGFAGFEITAKASVTPWDNTGTGTGDVTID